MFRSFWIFSIVLTEFFSASWVLKTLAALSEDDPAASEERALERPSRSAERPSRSEEWTSRSEERPSRSAVGAEVFFLTLDLFDPTQINNFV